MKQRLSCWRQQGNDTSNVYNGADQATYAGTHADLGQGALGHDALGSNAHTNNNGSHC
jgi:hypothetical protein